MRLLNCKALGESLESCSIKELDQVEQLLERSLNSIRARKEKKLMKENTRLRKKFEMLPLQLSINLPTVRPPAQAMEVETALFIGPPTTTTNGRI
ncbi:Agamous-like MADS-box protein [Sesamum angolense]|uniref:Agamous-like MADS-box protein n=1 Tax=Sesamum angolense TaxID=2727404 RepID=A0AAE1W9Q0_9LAMI|nr:Agamous-like MADS-box protein [Sesamum angolense]